MAYLCPERRRLPFVDPAPVLKNNAPPFTAGHVDRVDTDGRRV